MSKEFDRELVNEVMRAVAAFQDATDLVDDAAAARLGINRTDLRCLGILWRSGPITAGQLAQTAGLSPGATTTAVDRLVRAGYAHRTRDTADRRRVTVAVTPTASGTIENIWGPIGVEAHEQLTRRTREQLILIRDFLAEGCELQARHARRVSATGAP